MLQSFYSQTTYLRTTVTWVLCFSRSCLWKNVSYESREICMKWKSWKNKTTSKGCYHELRVIWNENFDKKMTTMLKKKWSNWVIVLKDHFGRSFCKWDVHVKVTLLNSKFLECYNFFSWTIFWRESRLNYGLFLFLSTD